MTQPAWCNYERDEVVPRDLGLIQRLVAMTSGDHECAITLDMVADAQATERVRRIEDSRRRRSGRTGTNG